MSEFWCARYIAQSRGALALVFLRLVPIGYLFAGGGLLLRSAELWHRYANIWCVHGLGSVLAGLVMAPYYAIKVRTTTTSILYRRHFLQSHSVFWLVDLSVVSPQARAQS